MSDYIDNGFCFENDSFIGKSIKRIDALEKVTGNSVYPDDIAPDNALYGATVRSSIPHGRIISIDKSEASALNGVVAVFTADDVPGHNTHGVLYKDHNVFCKDKVRRVGDPIAFVVAETTEIAESGAALVKVEYEELPGVFSTYDALKEGAPVVNDYEDRFFFYDKNKDQVFEKPDDYPYPNLIYRYRCRHGNWLDAAKNGADEDCISDSIWRKCAVTAESDFYSPFVDTAFLQPESGVAYIDENGRLVVTASTQYMHFDRVELADALGIKEDDIRIINPTVGGAFGAREDITLQIHIAIAALKLKRPVKATYSRVESFTAHSKRHPMSMKAKMGADADGKLLAFEAEIMSDSGSYASWAINVTRKAGIHITGPYIIPNVKVDAYAVYTNNPFTGAMRGFGATQVAMVHETLIEMLAEKLNIDALDIRRKNILKNGSQTANGQIIINSCPIDTCLDIVEQEMKPSIDAKNLKSVDKAGSTSSKPGVKRGYGVASCWYGTGYGNGFPDVSIAEVELSEQGDIILRVGAAEVGQGAKTIMPQIAGEVLGIDPSEIRILSEDSDECEDSGTAAATRQTYNTGNAVKLAAESFKASLIQEAIKFINSTVSEFDALNASHKFAVKNKNIYLEIFPSKSVTFEEVAKFIKSQGRSLRVKETFTAQTVKLDDNGQGAPYWPYTFNVYGVEIEVDTYTGRIQCLEGWCAQDVGRALNPKIVEGQIDGGFAMGLGYSVYEDLGVKNGLIKNNKYSQYIIPTSLDVPSINKYLIESPEETAPFGAKGIGEPVTVPVAPAILNAIYDAVGVRVTSLPVTPDKMLKALGRTK